MSSTTGDEGQGGRFGAKEVRTRRLPLVAVFSSIFTSNNKYKWIQIKFLSFTSKITYANQWDHTDTHAGDSVNERK